MRRKNDFVLKNSDIKIGLIVDTVDGDNGVIEKINPDSYFPYFVRFENGTAWQDIRHIKKVYPQQSNQ